MAEAKTNAPAPSQSSDTEQQTATNREGEGAPGQPSEEGPARTADENKVDGASVPKGKSGNSSHGPRDGRNKDQWKESDSKDAKRITTPILNLSKRNLK